MKTITIAREQTNITALDEALENVLLANYLGLSVHNSEVRVHLLRETPSDLVRQAEEIVQKHDPSQLTLGQQAEISKRQSLLQARNANPNTLDTIAYNGTDPLLQQLAHKLHWLEQEIRDLRDL
jgi:23S rRNA maturation mini-RNase III